MHAFNIPTFYVYIRSIFVFCNKLKTKCVQKIRTVYELNEVFIEKAAALVKAFYFCSSTQIVA